MARAVRAGHPVADPAEIVDGTRYAGNALMALRARLELFGRHVRRRAHLVGVELGEEGVPPPQDTLMRPEELVGRRDQHVAAKRRDVDWHMRGVLHRVDEGQGAGGPGPARRWKRRR